MTLRQLIDEKHNLQEHLLLQVLTNDHPISLNRDRRPIGC